jgi:hypothetical protein
MAAAGLLLPADLAHDETAARQLATRNFARVLD